MRVDVPFLDDLERQIRSNQGPSLKDLISNIKTKDVPRSLVFRYANILKRLGGVYHAIRYLNPIVRNSMAKPTDTEMIEYASCLTKLSLSDESLEILNSIQNEEIPEVHFERAAAYVAKWDYHLAKKHFEKYLSSKSISEYRSCVGEINLGASYIFTNEPDQAENILLRALERNKKNKFDLLCGNTLELLGQCAILKNDFAKAKEVLSNSSTYLGSANPRYNLYFEKAQIMAELFSEGPSPELARRLNSLRALAAKLRNWNTLRDIELFTAIATKDVTKIKDLYYGIPYIEYRKRIVAIWGKPLQNISTYDRKIGNPNQNHSRVFDVTKGIDLPSKQELKLGKTLHRLIQCLTSDFYAPFSTTKIFSLVFKGAHFNPESSQQQVYEAIKRLNQWFSEHNIDLKIVRGKAGYRLRSRQGYILRISGSPKMHSREDHFLTELLNAGFQDNFTIKMVIAALKIPRRSAIRRLTEAQEQGLLIRVGKGPATKYSIKK